MPFPYTIAYGIAFGLLSYIIIGIFTGDFKKIRISSWIIAFLFVAMLLLTHCVLLRLSPSRLCCVFCQGRGFPSFFQKSCKNP